MASDGVFLRAPTRRDEEEFLELVRQSRRLHRPWTSPPATPERFRAYVRRCRGADYRGLFVCRRADGRIVGVFNISQIIRGPMQSAFLGYWVGAPFAGHGYMTRGLALVLRHAFRTLKLHRIEANLQPGNLRSRALVRRAGFRKEGFSPRYLKLGGRWCDHERWALCKEEWRPPRSRRRRS
jgi:ribosomal-protein-alanine N-acetyltransferase